MSKQVKTYLTNKVVSNCRECPFFEVNTPEISCGHPTINPGSYDGYFINYENKLHHVNNIPKECPLRKEDTIKILEVKLS